MDIITQNEKFGVLKYLKSFSHSLDPNNIVRFVVNSNVSIVILDRECLLMTE